MIFLHRQDYLKGMKNVISILDSLIKITSDNRYKKTESNKVEFNDGPKSKINLQNCIITNQTETIQEYDFPNEDFCHFKHFPHSNLVFPIINTKLDLECSCTLLWL